MAEFLENVTVFLFVKYRKLHAIEGQHWHKLTKIPMWAKPGNNNNNENNNNNYCNNCAWTEGLKYKTQKAQMKYICQTK